jgi:[ribosomal protein S5]-alanine N-acetyltransferase
VNFRDITIQTSRFLLRPLTLADATEKYLGWMKEDSVAKYITAASDTQSLASLESYILEKSTKDDCLFLGVFDRLSGDHIGNIKYEPICFIRKEAVMGVLLGDSYWRGKNVFNEIFLASQQWLLDTYSIKAIVLDVDRSNAAAIRAYEKAGFTIEPDADTDDSFALKMMFTS